MRSNYWKVTCRYGHVGRKNEVSVARYISLDGATVLEVLDIISKMPGIKHKGVTKIVQIDENEYQEGKILEDENIYLQILRTFKPNVVNIKGEILCA